ncbi:hypothetical protein LTR53_005067 [Teratosphaeriaceae sp. CCFEE 6253]|nr:hypothetical protein LTR53_005067 [Teratosphaeriaceae sp. CCFEE 6253]
MGSSQPQETLRTARLSKLFDSYTRGSRAAKTPNDGRLLLEAICNRADATECIERLVGSKNALDAVRLSLRFDISPRFINTAWKDFVLYLQDGSVKQMCSGMLYRQLLVIIVQPSTLWHAIVHAHKAKQLEQQADLAFATLLLDILTDAERPPVDVADLAHDLTNQRTFLTSEDHDVRSIGYRVQRLLQASSEDATASSNGAGGRHDNDFVNYRKIAVFPTEDELLCKAEPFLRRADAVYDTAQECRAGIHLDNQFRLLREDFLAELRDDMGVGSAKKKSKRSRTRLHGLSLAGAYYGKARARHPFALAISFAKGAAQFTRLDDQGRKAYLKNNPKFLKHQAFGVLLDGEQIVGFATMSRVEELLLRDPPVVILQISNGPATEKSLLALKSSGELGFLIVDTSVFAYQPVLECLQSKRELPLASVLLRARQIDQPLLMELSSVSPVELADRIEDDDTVDLQRVLRLRKPVSLDESQTQSLLAGLRQSVSLIQGPPGTGKSFIGALLAKALHDHTSEKILVICFTNHALDQFLEDLLDVGIAPERMVRLGAKSTPRTKQLSLFELTHTARLPQAIWQIINRLDAELDGHQAAVDTLVSGFIDSQPSTASIMDYLEFSEHDSEFHEALQVPRPEDGETLVGKKGKKIGPSYLFDQWSSGYDAGVFAREVPPEHKHVWQLDKESRHRKLRAWLRDILHDMASGLSAAIEGFSVRESALRQAREQKDGQIINQRQIIACTTTAAAKYTRQLQSASPGIVLVEEAGEILESHVLTALTPSTKQLILIGDHQQLRPKVNNYQLTVERGQGYDLNRSLFERLIKIGLPHTTLHQQHRMCPEISSLVRDISYPHLVDAPSTRQREAVRGIRGRVIFIDHRQSELQSAIANRRDDGMSVSKQNAFEAAMVLKIVKYLAQQGYGTQDQVVLTP